MLSGRTLEQQGCSVAFAADGRLALEMLDAERYDLVLLDVEMPELDGVASLRKPHQEALARRTTRWLFVRNVRSHYTTTRVVQAVGHATRVRCLFSGITRLGGFVVVITWVVPGSDSERIHHDNQLRP